MTGMQKTERDLRQRRKETALEQQLRDNLTRRKQQARGRSAAKTVTVDGIMEETSPTVTIKPADPLPKSN